MLVRCPPQFKVRTLNNGLFQRLLINILQNFPTARSYDKTSLSTFSHKLLCFKMIVLKFGIGSTSVKASVKFQNDAIIQISNLLPPRTAWGLMTQQVQLEKDAVFRRPNPWEGKKKLSSRLADSMESEPWQAFLVLSEEEKIVILINSLRPSDAYMCQ